MTARDFVFWLQGYFELAESGCVNTLPIDFKQIDTIKRHLALVFKHEIDPAMGGPEKQAELQAVHDGDVYNYDADKTMRC